MIVGSCASILKETMNIQKPHLPGMVQLSANEKHAAHCLLQKYNCFSSNQVPNFLLEQKRAIAGLFKPTYTY